eukprot:14303927-Alexandrium_andersonii.AAC.1
MSAAVGVGAAVSIDAQDVIDIAPFTIVPAERRVELTDETQAMAASARGFGMAPEALDGGTDSATKALVAHAALDGISK